MNQNKEKYKKKSIFSDTLSLKYCIKWRSWETCFLLLAVLQFVLIAGFNLFDTPRAVDSDSAKLFLHAMEIAENKTLLLPGWIYTTTLEIDTAMLPAIPIYLLTGNIYLSFGIANILILSFFLCIILLLFRECGLPLRAALLSCNFLMLPFFYGMLDYFNMMFINGSQYILKVLMPLLFLLLLLLPAEKRKRPGTFFLLGITVFLYGLSAFSSGAYTLLVCAGPILACLILDVLRNGSLRRYSKFPYLVSALIFCAAAAGFCLNILLGLGLGAKGNNMHLLKWQDMFPYLQSCAMGIFQLFGALPDDEVRALSVEGIVYLLKLFFVSGLIFTFLINLKKGFIKAERPSLKQYLIGMVSFNLLILLVCDTRYNTSNTTMEYRYYLPAVVPDILLFTILLDEWNRKWSSLVNKILPLLLLSALLFVEAASFFHARSLLGEHDYCDTLCDYFETLDVKNIIFVDDRETTECCRLKDPGHRFSTWSAEENRMVTVDYYDTTLQKDYYEPHHALVSFSGTVLSDLIGEEKASSYTLASTILWFDIYISDQFLFL